MAARIASTFSLLALLLSCALADGFAEVRDQLDGATDPVAVREAVLASPEVRSDPQVARALQRLDQAQSEAQRTAAADEIATIVGVRALFEGAAPGANAAQQARQIKASPVYRDPGVQETSNWLSRALERLRNLRMRQMNAPNMRLPAFSLGGDILRGLMWLVILSAAGYLLFLGVKHVRWRQRLERRATALLEEEEPLRTIDEWLEIADRLEAEGRYREAVRALYLACLLRFDEALIARFDRGQTNWEHLARIEASPRLPEHIEFREPTRLFDRVWYGKILRGKEDVQLFRSWYIAITESVRRVAA
jgi:hypothetical protein